MRMMISVNRRGSVCIFKERVMKRVPVAFKQEYGQYCVFLSELSLISELSHLSETLLLALCHSSVSEGFFSKKEKNTLLTWEYEAMSSPSSNASCRSVRVSLPGGHFHQNQVLTNMTALKNDTHVWVRHSACRNTALTQIPHDLV